RLAILAVRRVRTITQRSQADRRTGDRVDAGEGEVLVGVERTCRAAQRHVVGHGQVVATSIGEQLERSVTEDVPARAQARRPLVLLLGIHLAVGVEVLERLVAQAQRQQPVVGDLPAVFQVVRRLVDREGATVRVPVLRHVVAAATRAHGAAATLDRLAGGTRSAGAVDPAVAGRAGGHFASARGRVLAVIADAQRMAADLPLQIYAEALGLVEGIRERELRKGAALDRVGHRPRIAHGDDAGAIAERNRDVILFLRAVHGRQRQRIGQVTGVLADVQLAAVLVEVATGLLVATDGLVGARGVGVREVIHRLLGDVGDGGQLDDVVVG